MPLSIYKILFKNHFQEGLRIFPFFYLNKGFARFYYGLRCALFNIETNVSFLQIDMKGSDFISLSCDWCSIMNGMIETAKTNLLYDPTLSDLLDMPNLNYVSDFLRKCLKKRKDQITDDKINKFCLKTFNQITYPLYVVSKIYLQLEDIETRWCPFKRAKEFYYRNSDPRYFSVSETNFYSIGKILSKYDNMTCNNCPKIVNNEWVPLGTTKPSVFIPLLEWMVKDINAVLTTIR